MMGSVDVVIQVYGKPHQTAVTLLSLLEHSGTHVGKIWFIEERQQPFGAEFSALRNYLHDRLIHYRPPIWLGSHQLPWRSLHRWGPLRRSLRYQCAWEKSKQRYLYVTHNDVLYTDDILRPMLDRIEGHIAVGPVGQCWNCSAWKAQVCTPESFMEYRPSFEEWTRLSTRYPGARMQRYAHVVEPARPWPLPECRVNEWTLLVDLDTARPSTMPIGDAVPIGASYGLDTGTQWFHDVVNAGHRVRHMDTSPFAQHAWASSTGGGYPALFDHGEYMRGEAMAFEQIRSHYPAFFRCMAK
jgi:hypothetical protein